jgi:hypothetical protein
LSTSLQFDVGLPLDCGNQTRSKVARSVDGNGDGTTVFREDVVAAMVSVERPAAFLSLAMTSLPVMLPSLDQT